MKTTVLMTLFIGLFAFTSCEKEVLPAIPTCIQNEMDDFKKDTCAGQVNSYTYNGRTIFAFADSDEYCSDGGINILDENGVQICYLGGIAGFTECEEMNFAENAVHLNLIWRK